MPYWQADFIARKNAPKDLIIKIVEDVFTCAKKATWDLLSLGRATEALFIGAPVLECGAFSHSTR
jgi:hypothetical protein